jgi:hypothetical protein
VPINSIIQSRTHRNQTRDNISVLRSWHCGVGDSYRCFGETFCLHFHARMLSWRWSQYVSPKRWYPPTRLHDVVTQKNKNMSPRSCGNLRPKALFEFILLFMKDTGKCHNAVHGSFENVAKFIHLERTIMPCRPLKVNRRFGRIFSSIFSVEE